MEMRYTNPVYDHDFPDPCVLKTQDGYYAYASQGLAAGGSMHNIQAAYSRDLIHWEPRADALPIKAAWASAQEYWAPDMVQAPDGSYRLFFNAKSDASGQGIGVARSSSLGEPFVANETPLIIGEGYEHIDAHTFRDPASGTWYLVWGSERKPIKMRELADDLLSFKEGTTSRDILLPDPSDPMTALYEAPFILYHVNEDTGQPFYYLLTSGPDAFGDETYTVQVARAESLQGPFIPMSREKNLPTSIIYASSASFINPGATVITTDSSGGMWAVSHATKRSDIPDYEELRNDPDAFWQRLRYTKRVMILDPLTFSDGWPSIGNGTPCDHSNP